jgi:TolB protein
MKKKFLSIGQILALGAFLIVYIGVVAGCGGTTEESGGSASRSDEATLVAMTESGSHQNPAWSPDGSALLFTRWRSGYNTGAADLFVVTLADLALRTLVSDGSANVNLPGSASTWNGTTDEIVFTSSRDPHDEAYVIGENGARGSATQVTSRPNHVVFEASLSPDAQSIVFESHQVDVEDNGVIFRYKRDGSEGYVPLTPAGMDCRQPVWSPTRDKIVCQCKVGGQFAVFVMKTDGATLTQVTGGAGEMTDPSFSPDGLMVVYSSNEGGLAQANLFVVPVTGGHSTRVTNYSGYDGAPSWSPDGTKIAFESSPSDPDGSAGTKLYIIAALSP